MPYPPDATKLMTKAQQVILRALSGQPTLAARRVAAGSIGEEPGGVQRRRPSRDSRLLFARHFVATRGRGIIPAGACRSRARDKAVHDPHRGPGRAGGRGRFP